MLLHKGSQVQVVDMPLLFINNYTDSVKYKKTEYKNDE